MIQYQCNGMSINGISSASPQDIIEGLGIVVDEVGTQNSSLTVPVGDLY